MFTRWSGCDSTEKQQQNPFKSAPKYAVKLYSRKATSIEGVRAVFGHINEKVLMQFVCRTHVWNVEW